MCPVCKLIENLIDKQSVLSLMPKDMHTFQSGCNLRHLGDIMVREVDCE